LNDAGVLHLPSFIIYRSYMTKDAAYT